jgi:hypothetical protein
VTVLGRDDAPPTPRELLRALRYPDRSVVIDLSRLPQDEKVQYVRSVLPALNVLRLRTGLPHRILLDEAHYYIHDVDAQQLLDFERNGYIIVTYCAARLPPALLANSEVMIVTCGSNPSEIDALRACCARCAEVDAAHWSLLAHLKVGQAVALPITEETAGELRLFTIAPRLTTHVRHREKYVDVPVSEHRAFVFNANGQPVHRIQTLRQFVSELEKTPSRCWRDTSHAATSRAGLATCSAIGRSPTNFVRSKSAIAAAPAVRSRRTWRVPCAGATTSPPMDSRRPDAERVRIVPGHLR